MLPKQLQQFDWIARGDLTSLRTTVIDAGKGLTNPIMSKWLRGALEAHQGRAVTGQAYYACDDFARLAAVAIGKLAAASSAK